MKIIEKTKTAQCLVDQQKYLSNEGKTLQQLDRSLRNLIKSRYPHANDSDFICDHHLLEYRLYQVNRLLDLDQHRNRKINRKLTKTLKNDHYEVTDVNDTLNKQLTFGQRVSDNVARFGGSWGFIFFFVSFLIGWMIINIFQLFGAHFDPYPFILLNLALSCISAVQAPIIMMSQNRTAEHDRLNSENDYHVNLKSEHELRILHAKLDQLNQNQMPHNLEIEKIQLEMLGEVRLELSRVKDERQKIINERMALERDKQKLNQSGGKSNAR